MVARNYGKMEWEVKAMSCNIKHKGSGGMPKPMTKRQKPKRGNTPSMKKQKK